MKTDSEMREAERQRAEDVRRGRPVPYVIVGFYLTFMLMFFAFVYIAMRYPPSETTKEAYQKGLEYNRVLEKNDKGRALGWKADAQFSQKTLTYRLVDANGSPIEDALVKAWFVHPSDSKRDQVFELSKDGKGIYSAMTDSIGSAHWHIHITAARGENQIQTKIEAEVE